MIKNDPYKLLEKEDIAKNLLSDHVKEALTIYDETLEGLKEYPDDKGIKGMAEKIGKEAVRLLKAEIERLKESMKDEVVEKEKHKVKQAQSKRVKEKAQKSIDRLENCRKELREDRQRKLASGEIKAPVKKRLSSKLKDSLKRIVNMMPKAIREDPSKIQQTEKAIMKFLGDLKKIWGMNNLKPLEEELKAQIEKIEEKEK